MELDLTDLTKEQKFTLESQRVHNENAIAAEKLKADIQEEAESRKVKLELIRMAKDVLVENRRNAPIGERDVTHEDIIAYASSLAEFVNS